jgi:hypothetical protein
MNIEFDDAMLIENFIHLVPLIEGSTVEDQFKSIIPEAKKLITLNNSYQFMVAVAAVMSKYDEESEEFQRLDSEMIANIRCDKIKEEGKLNKEEAIYELIKICPTPYGLLSIWVENQ